MVKATPGWLSLPDRGLILGILHPSEHITIPGNEARLLAAVMHKKMWQHAADRLQSAHMGIDSSGERLLPTCPGEREPRRAKHGDKIRYSQ